MTKTWTEKDALELIAKVESEFMAHLTTLEQPMAKSEDESKEDESKEETAEQKEAAAKKKKEDESKKEEASEEKSGEMAAMDKAESSVVEPSEEKEIEDLYASMTKAEKDAHYGALKKVMATEEMKKSEQAPASTEVKTEDNKEVALIKAEFDAVKASNEELKKANEELKKAAEETQKNLNAVIEALKSRFVKKPAAPKQKAITELSALSKSEKTGSETSELSRNEVKKILTEKAKEPTLKKSDRDLINAYCYEKVGVDKIKHLLVNK